ncbi:lipase/acyltransferase domain-containing protein [Nostoc sp.]|uniref:lipase/acyltransferase domain-containing protein n=1 Tax=Nostoc sp. TaxID=1180 RepID=UPI002FF47AF2
MKTAMKTSTRATFIAWVSMLVAVVPAHAHYRKLTPVVVFPAFHLTILEVKVQNQSVFPECPASGKFEDWYLNPNPNPQFTQVCKDKLLTLVYKPASSKPMAERFYNQPGVEVKLKQYGSTESAPFYKPLYKFLEAAGYKSNVNIRVAGYDSRLTPDMDNFLIRTKRLIEQTYYQNKNTPVHLVAHSNGPFYAQYLLTHTTQAWKNKFIHGFTPIAGNWPGQGLLYPVYFTGLNVIDFSFPKDPANAASSAAMYQTHPSSYMSSSDPAVFGNREVVVRTVQGGKTYTPQDYQQLFQDAGLSLAQQLAPFYIGFVKFAPPFFPNVDVYAEKGSGLDTIVGAQLQNLSLGQVLNDSTVFFKRDGDSNQEDITNDAIAVWAKMPCYRFVLTDNPSVGHFDLPSNPAVLQRLLANLQQTKSVCPFPSDYYVPGKSPN